MIVLLAPTVELARLVKADVTIEAEYGAEVIQGSIYTAAHHQPAGSPFAGFHAGGTRNAPCADGSLGFLEAGTVLLSHVDLDSIGGCLRLLPVYHDLFDSVEDYLFWTLAEWVDVNGPHKLGKCPAALMPHVAMLHAFWAWHKANPCRYERDAITVVTHHIHAAGDALRRILARDAELLAAGEAFKAKEADLNKRTYHGAVCSGTGRDVIVRYTNAEFVSHLYTTPTGAIGHGVAAYDEGKGEITLSVAETTPGVSCRAILQGLFGDKAGGHDNIAGSPRGQRMSPGDFTRALNAFLDALGK